MSKEGIQMNNESLERKQDDCGERRIAGKTSAGSRRQYPSGPLRSLRTSSTWTGRSRPAGGFHPQALSGILIRICLQVIENTRMKDYEMLKQANSDGEGGLRPEKNDFSPFTHGMNC